MITLMAAVSTFCGLVIVVSAKLTEPAIQRNLARIAQDAVFEIMPKAKSITIFGIQPSGEITKLSGPTSGVPKLYACYDADGRLLGVVCEGAGRGYADVIKVLYAYSPEGQCITGFKVLESKETPGLGDKIGKDKDFLANFNDLDVRLNVSADGLEHPIEAVKHGKKTQKWQIDGISGATISSRAVARLLNESADSTLPVVLHHLDELKKGN